MSVPFNSILIASRLPLALFSSSTRLLCTLLSVFAIALTPNGHWWTWAIYGLGIRSYIAPVASPNATETGAVEFAFVGVVLRYFVPQWRPSDLVLGTATNYNSGLTVLGSVTLKALLSLLIMNVLILTTSIPALHALVALRTPC